MKMKKLILIIILIFEFDAQAQVVFCPPGAEWHYLFSGSIFAPGNTYNETIKYVGDTIDGPDTLKILTHNRFFLACGPWVWPRQSYLKQKGDTVYFKNNLTSGTWQILYNYAALTGHSWQTTINLNSTVTKTFTFTVQSVNTVTINGFALKQLDVTSSGIWSGSKITERFGANMFLFNYTINSPSSCDWDVFQEFLCYKDSVFGTNQFGAHDCYYYTLNANGISENNEPKQARIFPNPTQKFIQVEFENPCEAIEILLINSQGQVFSLPVNYFGDSKIQCHLEDLASGLYFLKIFEKGNLITSKKIMKQ